VSLEEGEASLQASDFEGLIAPAQNKAGEFRAMAVTGKLEEGKFWVSDSAYLKALHQHLKLTPGEPVIVMPYYID
jgi:hypothetical protein